MHQVYNIYDILSHKSLCMCVLTEKQGPKEQKKEEQMLQSLNIDSI